MKQIIVDDKVTSYYISENGRCFNLNTGKFLKGQISNSGYLNYNLSLNGYKKRFYAHRLIAQYFLNNGRKLDKNQQVNHIDCNKKNNYVKNLEIVSPSENMLHAKKNGLLIKKVFYQFDSKLKLIKKHNYLSDLSDDYCISVIFQELNSKKKSLIYNFYWSYKNVLNKNDILNFKNTGKPKSVSKLDKNGKVLSTYSSLSEAGRVNFPEQKRAISHISECCRGKLKHYKGYFWKYTEDIV